jgi:integrase
VGCPYRRDGGWYIDTDTKSHQRRTVPISKGLAAELAELRHTRTPLPDPDAKRRRLARRASRYAVVNADLVFTAQRGGYISKSLDNTLIHRAFDGAEIEAPGRNVH